MSLCHEPSGPHIRHPDLDGPQALFAEAPAVFAYSLPCIRHTASLHVTPVTHHCVESRSPVAGSYPSLHLNLGECYRKLGDLDLARHHLECGWAAVGALPDDDYGRMIAGGLTRLAIRLNLTQP